jgi:signal transduction histidine kinase
VSRIGVPALGAVVLFGVAAEDSRSGFDLLHAGGRLLVLALALPAAARLVQLAARGARPRSLCAGAALLGAAAAALGLNALILDARVAAAEAGWRDAEAARLEERARRLRAEFADLLADLEAPIVRARASAARNPVSGAPAAPARAFALLEAVAGSPEPRGASGVSLYTDDPRPLAWWGSTRPVPEELLVLSIPEGGTKWLAEESGGLTRLVALSRPWKGSGVLIVAERVADSVFDPRIRHGLLGGRALRPGDDRLDLADFRRPPVALAELFEAEGDLLRGPEAGRPILHAALRAPDGAYLGFATLTGRPESVLHEETRSRHAAVARWLVVASLALLLCGSLLPRRGPPPVAPWGEIRRQLFRVCGIWFLRIVLLPYAIPIRVGGQALDDPALFARAGRWGLLRSPQDALLTALAVLATGILVSLAASRVLLAAPRGRRRPAAACFAGSLLIAFVLGAAIPEEAWELVNNARVDVLSVSPLDPSPARIALQVAAAFTLLGFVLPLATLAWGAVWAASSATQAPAPAPPVPTEETLRWVALLLAPCALASCAILEMALQPAATGVLKSLLGTNVASIVRSMQTYRRLELRESIEAIRELPALPERIATTVPGEDPALARDLWSVTPIASRGYAASFTVGDPNGVLLSRFSMNFPSILDREERRLEEENPPPDEVKAFQAGSARRPARALHMHTNIEDEAGIVGVVTVHLRNDFVDLPPLTPETPLQAALGESRVLSPLLQPWARTVGLVVYDGHGVPVPPSPRNPPPAPPEEERGRLLSDSSEELWRRRAVPGGTVHELFFGVVAGEPDREEGYVVGLSFLEPGPLGRTARTIKLTLQTVFCLVLLMTPWAVASALRLEWSLSPARLVQALSRTHYRRLLATFLMASIAPLGLLAVGLTEYVTTEIDKDVTEQGLTLLESARQQVEDVSALQAEEGPAADDGYLFDLSEVAGGEELAVYLRGDLWAASNRDLYDVGALPTRLDGEIFKQIVVDGDRVVVGSVHLGGRTYKTISAAVSLGLGDTGVLSIMLAGRRADLEHRAQDVYDTLLLTTASIVFFMSVLAYHLARRIAAPIRRLSAATTRIAIGDLDAEVASPARDETGDLVASFNHMARALRKQREELEQRGNYIEKILLNATTGILSVDFRGRIVTINPAAAAILGLGDLRPGQDIAARLSESPDCAPLLRAVRECLAAPSAPRQVEAELGPAGEERHARVRIVPFAEGAGLLLFLDDVTETIRYSRLAAWAEMARRIAHEIKNPLTPIQLSADHIRRVHADGSPEFAAILQECLRTINEQVAALREIAAQFSQYSRLPVIRKEPTPMKEFLAEVIRPYRVAPPRGVAVECDLDGDLGTLEIDRALLSQALVNLIENALQAMPDGGRLMLSACTSGAGPDRTLQVIVADTGVGMDVESLSRAFEPYFSTKGSGTGLGMAIARRAVEEHRGRIELTSAVSQGTTARIVLPAA